MKSGKEKRKKQIRVVLITVLAASVLVVLAAGLIPLKTPGTPSGIPRYSSRYLSMPDGVRIAVRVALPPDLEEGMRIPSVMEMTRYGTAMNPGFLLRVLLNLHIARISREGSVEEALTEAGFAYVAVDARGSGASFGVRDMELSREEIADSGEVVDWIVSQSWSNGKVGSYGMSYSGTTAELALTTGRKALAAAAPFYPDFDPIIDNVIPGGILNDHLIRNWNLANQRMDSNSGHDLFFTGPAPVDRDRTGRLVRKALKEHRTVDMYEISRSLVYSDDPLAPGYKTADLASWKYRLDIEASGAPLFVRAGWQDAGTVNGALERYLTFSNPQLLVIGPWSHGGWHSEDPFLPLMETKRELDTEQGRELIGFFSSVLRDPAGPVIREKRIRYYTYGEGVWKESPVWPVPGFTNHRLWFGGNGSLTAEASPADSVPDLYTVDFTASTGENSRWRTNLGGGAVVYPDRAEEAGKLLCYTGPALEQDFEITGAPVVTLNLASTAVDGAVYVYLEDVAPDGRVTYLTEGMLRLIHHRIPEETPPHAVLGPWHSLKREDAEALVPGEPVEVSITMQATSVLLRKGHRIRIALAGHDASSFQRIPAEGTPVLSLFRGGDQGSRLDLPGKVR